MGNFTGKEIEGGKDVGQQQYGGMDAGSRTEPGRPGGFHFANHDGGGDGMEVDATQRFEDAAEEELVPTVFRWEHGGRQVYITGTFNNWEKQIQMHRSGNDFTYIHNLKKVVRELGGSVGRLGGWVSICSVGRWGCGRACVGMRVRIWMRACFW